MKRTLCLRCFCLLLWMPIQGLAQTIQNVTTISQANPLVFRTYEDINNGLRQMESVNVVLRQNGNSAYEEWKLVVRLSSDYENTSGKALLSAQYGMLEFNSASQAVVDEQFPAQLRVDSFVNLVRGQPFNGELQLFFDFSIMGGTHLMDLPSGFYDSNYEFQLYGKTAGGTWSLISEDAMNNNTSRFKMDYAGASPGTSIILQNAADFFSLSFNNEADYVNGVSSFVADGLSISNKGDYQVMVRSSNPEFTSTDGGSIIPVSVLNLELTALAPDPNLQVNAPVGISANDQLLLERINYSNREPDTHNFDVRFFVPPNAIAPNIEAGTYSTNVFFMIVPL